MRVIVKIFYYDEINTYIVADLYIQYTFQFSADYNVYKVFRNLILLINILKYFSLFSSTIKRFITM